MRLKTLDSGTRETYIEIASQWVPRSVTLSQ